MVAHSGKSPCYAPDRAVPGMIAARDLSRLAASQTAVVPPQRSVELAEGLRQARQTLFQDLRLRA
ncbi:MAG: hypothetical protein IIY70_03180, partial [Oscillospiraceae bacterium]|nr:hypothetical protein [Oscillospiraceae bacterium]